MRRLWKWSKIYKRRLVIALVLIALMPIVLNWYVDYTTRNLRFVQVAAVPARPVAIVFGAGLDPNGAPSPMLAARIQQAAALYQHGTIQKLLFTGDNSSTNYDEVTAMQRYAESLGVPADVITLDYAGFSTYDSCYRAKAIFGVASAVVVTQDFHLPRAVFTCRALGLDVVGIEAPDQHAYPSKITTYYRLREVLATSKAIWHVMWRPEPTFLGKFEGMN